MRKTEVGLFMLNDCGKSPFKLAHTGYEGKGWVIAYALYDSDDYSFDDGYSNAWTSKEDFDAFVDIPTSDGIKEMLAQNGRSNYREDYVVELYPIEATFKYGRWTKPKLVESMDYIYKGGEWIEFSG